MSDDALAALLNEWRSMEAWAKEVGAPNELPPLENFFAARGVVVLPPDHPLRTGEPSEAMKRAIQDAITVTVKLLDDEADAVGRAALAVLREPLDKQG